MSDDDLIRRVAAALWKAEAVDAGTPQSVADGRTPEAFEDQSDYIRAKWTKFARASIAALPARGVGVKPQDVLNAAWRDDLGEEGRAMYARILAALAAAVPADLSDPVTVHANMLRGSIAKPTVEQIIHLYGREAFRPVIDAAVAKALEDACLAVSEHADWPEDEHGRTEQVGLFARVINAIRSITPAVTHAAHVNETPKSEHDAGNVLTPAQAREAALLERASVLCQQEADRGQKNGQFGYHLGAVACRDAILALIGESRT